MVIDNNIELLGVFGLSALEKVLDDMKRRLKYLPNDLIFLNKKNVGNIYDEYEDLVKTGYPIIEADKYNKDSVHFVGGSWTTINKIHDNLNLPKTFLLAFFESIYYLSRIGKIPLSIVDPKKKKESEVLKEFIKIGKGAKWMVPLLIITVGLFAMSQLQTPKMRLNNES